MPHTHQSPAAAILRLGRSRPTPQDAAQRIAERDAQPLATRRAGQFRRRANQLTEAAARELRDEVRRRHLLDLAATYRRSADALAGPTPREMLIEHLKNSSAGGARSVGLAGSVNPASVEARHE